jgi:hypothetical protein
MITAFLLKEGSALFQAGDLCERSHYHVMTLSATGDADTPAGGSVCMRLEQVNIDDRVIPEDIATNLEVAHKTTSCSCRHDCFFSWRKI